VILFFSFYALPPDLGNVFEFFVILSAIHNEIEQRATQIHFEAGAGGKKNAFYICNKQRSVNYAPVVLCTLQILERMAKQGIFMRNS
jgi:hypothetical protein